MKDYKKIYKLPKWYWKNREYANRKAKTVSGVIEVSEVDHEASFKNLLEIEDWIIKNVWHGDTKDKQFLSKRLSFLWNLRDKTFDKYQDMSIEKDMIYEFDTDGKIAREANKIYYGT